MQIIQNCCKTHRFSVGIFINPASVKPEIDKTVNIPKSANR